MSGCTTVSVGAHLRRGFLVLSILTLSACSMGSPPRDNFYRLASESAIAPLSGGPIEGVIDVPPFRAAGIVNERAILFRSGTNKLSQYSYHHWFEPPGVLLQRATINVLRGAEAFEMVTSPEMRLDRDYELLGNLRRFEHIPATSSVIVEMEITVRLVRGNEALVLKTYSAEVPASGRSVDAVVAGLSEALGSIFGELLDDLAQARANI
jgi:cholesterol transport system auxiliary component